MDLLFSTLITNNYRLVIAKLKADGTGTQFFAPQEINTELAENAEWLGNPSEIQQDWGSLQLDKSVIGKPLTVARKRYNKGIGTHAGATLLYNLNGKYERLTAILGLDEAEFCSNGAQVKVLGDGKQLADTGKLGYNSEYSLDISLKGVEKLVFSIDPLGEKNCDHIDIAIPMLFPVEVEK
jgi:hypothetical protein